MTMETRYIIACSTDAYSAGRHTEWKNKKTLETSMGRVKWVHDDHSRYGYTLDEVFSELETIAANRGLEYERGDMRLDDDWRIYTVEELEYPHTLEEFADLINSSDEWELWFNDIIKWNGWKELAVQWYVCTDGNRKIMFNDGTEAVVVDMY